MKFPDSFNPYGIIALGTPFELRPFAFVYSDGAEVFSIIVPEVRETEVARISAGTPDPIDLLAVPRRATDNPTSLLRYIVCRWLGREADYDRCTLGIRVRDDGRVEIRVRFNPPWWWQYKDQD